MVRSLLRAARLAPPCASPDLLGACCHAGQSAAPAAAAPPAPHARPQTGIAPAGLSAPQALILLTFLVLPSMMALLPAGKASLLAMVDFVWVTYLQPWAAHPQAPLQHEAAIIVPAVCSSFFAGASRPGCVPACARRCAREPAGSRPGACSLRTPRC
jgi:hypothetical protein